MSDISSASGETDSQLELIFPIQDEIIETKNGPNLSNCITQLEEVENMKNQKIQQFPHLKSNLLEENQVKEYDSSQVESSSSIVEDDDYSDFFDEEEEDEEQNSNLFHENGLLLHSSSAAIQMSEIASSKPSKHNKQHNQIHLHQTVKDQQKRQQQRDQEQEEDCSQSFLNSSPQEVSHLYKQSQQSDEVSFSYTGKTNGSAVIPQINQTSQQNQVRIKISNFDSREMEEEEEDEYQKLDYPHTKGSLMMNEKLKNQFRKYQDLASLIPSLRNFEWYETSAFQNKILPSKFKRKLLFLILSYQKVKFITPISFWFMVCAEYFPRNLVYKREEDIIREIRSKINKLPLEIVNRTLKFNSGKVNGSQSAGNDENVFIKEQRNEESENILRKNQDKRESFLEEQIDDLLSKERLREFHPVKISYQNKYSYNIDDEIYIIQQRIFLMNSIKEMNLISDFSDEEAMIQTKELDLDKMIDFLTFNYQQQQKKTQIGFELLLRKMKKDFNDERRINSPNDINFEDILVDLNSLNPVENKFISFLETKQQAESNSTFNQLSKDQSSKSHGIALAKQSEEYICQVCNEVDYADNDLIVYCSRCNLSVHQKCYGIPTISQDDWVCDTCKSFGPSAKYLRCALCPKKGGALKRSKMPIQTLFFEQLNPSYHEYLSSLQTAISQSKCQPNEIFDDKDWKQDKEKRQQTDEQAIVEGQEIYFNFPNEENKVISEEEANKFEPKNTSHIWAHLTCTLWIQECYFEERSSMNLVKGIENIDKKKFALNCGICKLKKTGCCVQCAKGKCTTSFHPECARRAGLSMEVRALEKITHLIYCQRHTPLKLRRILEQKERKSKEEIQKFCKSIEKYNETYFNEFKPKIKDKLSKTSKQMIKDQEAEDNNFMKSLSYMMIFGIQKGQGNEERVNYNENLKHLHLNHLKTITKQDEIWYRMEFKGYLPEQLFKIYRRLIKFKKIEFKKIFNCVKKEKEKFHEEMAILENKIHRQEIIKIEKERALQEKEINKQVKMIEQQRNGGEQLSPKKRKHIKHDYFKEGGFNQTKNDESLYQTLSKKVKLSDQETIKDKERTKQVNEHYVEVKNDHFCYCQKKYTEGEVMIQCSECEEWFHFECIGYTGTENQTEKLDFCCSECDTFEGKRILNKQIYQQLFDPYLALYQTYKTKRQIITIPLSTITQSYKDVNNNNNSQTSIGNKNIQSCLYSQQQGNSIEGITNDSDDSVLYKNITESRLNIQNISLENISTSFKLTKNNEGVVFLI